MRKRANFMRFTVFSPAQRTPGFFMRNKRTTFKTPVLYSIGKSAANQSNTGRRNIPGNTLTDTLKRRTGEGFLFSRPCLINSIPTFYKSVADATKTKCATNVQQSTVFATFAVWV